MILYKRTPKEHFGRSCKPSSMIEAGGSTERKSKSKERDREDMTLEQFYESNKGSYLEMKGRLRNDDRILKYLNMFLRDTSYEELKTAMEQKDYKAGFAASHNLKGVCANLGLTALFEPASEICEELRNGTPGDDVQELMDTVTEQYEKMVKEIKEL